ncbi:MAG: hypothetical protein U0169_01060 [Polyangiaceae bacterium]
MTSRNLLPLHVALVATAFLFSAGPGCSNDKISDDPDGSANTAGTAGSAGTSGTSGTAGTSGDTDGGDGSTPDDCVRNPVTHEDIINACTTSERIDAKPVLPLLRADGTLPPLP